MATLGLPAMPGLVSLVSKKPTDYLWLADCFGTPELALPAARAFVKLKSIRRMGREWLLKFPAHAACGLIAPALGKACEARDCASAALRMLRDRGHEALLYETAQRYGDPKVVQALRAMLDESPLDRFPAKRSKLPEWWQPCGWTRPLLKNGKALPEQALDPIGHMMSFPSQAEVYGGLAVIKEACQTHSLADFAFDCFKAWLQAGGPSKDGWGLTALAHLGNDDTARKLPPFIRAWPGESAHARAVIGLDVLANIGSDVALMLLNGIAQKVKFKGLQDKATEKIDAIAKARELTTEELEDRLAPDLGLDGQGTLLLELGPEALTALANAGFVKRALKEVAAGQVPKLEVADDGAVTALFDDGIRTQLPAGSTLRDARCNCQASTMCRHRVVLVLAYQAQYQAQAQNQTQSRDRHSEEASASAAPEPPALGAVPGTGPAGAERVERAERAEGVRPPWEFWSPAGFDDAALADSFGPGILAQAAKLAADRPVVTLQAARPGQPPGARLPMCSVQFFSRHSLAHARCDCKQGSGCAHVVVALWAFLQWENHVAADGGASGAATNQANTGLKMMVEVQPPDDSPAGGPPRNLMQTEAARAACSQIFELLQTLWLDGSGQPLVALEARMEAVRAHVNALGWSWVEDALDELWQLLRAQHARSSRFDARRLLTVLVELWARLHAAGHVEATGPTPNGLPASQILGLGVKGEVALDHLRLVSLGAVLWSGTDSEGAEVLLADPDTQTVTVLSREWPRESAAAAGAVQGGAPGSASPVGAAVSALMNRRVAGFPLRQFAAGQVISKMARRSANGRIDFGAGMRQTGVMPLSPSSWDDLRTPLRHTSVAGLVAQLQADMPDFVKPRQAASGAAAGFGGAMHLLDLRGMTVTATHWDAAAQVLYAHLQARETGSGDAALYLELPYRLEAPGAVDAMAHVLGAHWGALRAVAGPVQLRAGQATMQPLAFLTEERGVVLQVQEPPPQSLESHRYHREEPALYALAVDTLGLMTQWLRQGLRHQGGTVHTRIQEHTELLQGAGLHHCARLLGEIPGRLHVNTRDTLPGLMATLGLLLHGVGR